MGEKQRKRVQYWLESSEDDWKVANHLFEKGDYSYSLFFGHLTIEKMKEWSDIDIALVFNCNSSQYILLPRIPIE